MSLLRISAGGAKPSSMARRIRNSPVRNWAASADRPMAALDRRCGRGSPGATAARAARRNVLRRARTTAFNNR
eukprot:CAMPEP_0115320356 /NCGR_PEP_ID=MMETSP0270-20121206/80275_1 /TAXON_ID=71861 /ORGANISM="Scrippsiella trochoidea, Strain CCMP3099" /LENGTH=72 /DNA_ID=CAMNT_0002740149 /DNA_START=58 /DNA_END=274 /DNA_ORIENTATION=-